MSLKKTTTQTQQPAAAEEEVAEQTSGELQRRRSVMERFTADLCNLFHNVSCVVTFAIILELSSFCQKSHLKRSQPLFLQTHFTKTLKNSTI